jgi:serine/threonine protein kinase
MATEPHKLGKYNIVGKIGKGAMGEVYKGHDPVLNRYVAIKIIAETLGTDADLVERFKREARNAAQLNHPNIVTIFDFVEEEGHLYMVMELLEGQDLKELIKSGAPVTVEQILSIMEQIADGLGFAHSKGIIHRDLKPANIHVSKNGQVKILDFGLVHEASSDMTKTGQVMGTPNYMSPEQVQGLKVDPRSDIFSLGAVFYELLTRKKPFSADSIHATMFKVVQGDREPLGQYTHLPRPLVALVDRALDKDPDGRFPDAKALREHLRSLRREITRGSGDADSTMTTGEEATIVTPAAEPGSFAGTPVGAEKSGPSRSASAAFGSASRGTLRRGQIASASIRATPTPASRPVALYALAGLLVVGAAAGVYFMTRGGGSPGRDVQELSQQLIASQVELMEQALEQRDYKGALSRAEEILKSDPSNSSALSVQEEARNVQAQIDAAVAEARAAIARGSNVDAANALAKVLSLDPNHPLGVELASQLNQHFQSQAEKARAEMETARGGASGARERPEYARAEQERQTASDSFNRSEFTVSAQKFLDARNLFDQARAAQQQVQAQKQAEAAADAQAKAALEAKLRDVERVWNQKRNQPADAALTQQPSYSKAIFEEQMAVRAKQEGDLETAARSYENASGFLDSARRELADAERRAREDASRRVDVTPPPPPTSVPVTTSLPAKAQEEAAIRQVLATYVKSVESKNIALFRQVKPNLTPDEEKRLVDSFGLVDSQKVELSVDSIAIDGERATVTVTRRDLIIVKGRPQNGHSRQQQFFLVKLGGNWVIDQIGQ